jgi:hypothetical protein
MTNERETAAARLPLIASSLLAAAAGVFHAALVLLPLLLARFTAVLSGYPPDPQFQVEAPVVLGIAAVPVLAIASSLWAVRSARQAAVGEGVAGVAALFLALYDIGGGTSGTLPGALLLLAALLTYARTLPDDERPGDIEG